MYFQKISEKNKYNCYHPTDLFVAIHTHDITVVDQLSKKPEAKQEMYKRNISGDTAFHYAILNHNVKALKILLRCADDDRDCLTQKNHAGNSILQLAASENMGEVAEQICQHSQMSDSIINATHPESGNTPLHWATIHGNLSLLQTLLKYGSAKSIRTRNKKKKTPVFKSVEYNHPLILDTLLSEDALLPVDALLSVDDNALEMADSSDITPLCKAISLNLHHCVRILLVHHATISTKALSLSIELKRKEILVLLIAKYGKPIPEGLMKDAEKLVGYRMKVYQWKSSFEGSSLFHMFCFKCSDLDTVDDEEWTLTSCDDYAPKC